MDSQFAIIADAARDVVAGLAGAPTLVEVRDTDVVHPEEIAAASSIGIITMGSEYEVGSVSGAGTDTDQGDRLMAYEVGFSLYLENLAANATIGVRQDFVKLCQTALNKTRLAGATTVYGTKLVRRTAWENRPFRDGVEKSVFLVVFLSAETRLGN